MSESQGAHDLEMTTVQSDSPSVLASLYGAVQSRCVASRARALVWTAGALGVQGGALGYDKAEE